MSGTGFLRLAKLTGAGIVLVASRHNKRELQAETGASPSIEVARSHLNYSLVGPLNARAVADEAKRLMADAGVLSIRKDAVRAVEVVFSLPGGFSGDAKAYFRACLNWCGERFCGQSNILSFDVHLDEAQIHAHALILPLCGGRMCGSDLVGNRKTLAAHHQAFHDAVGSRFGLRRAKRRLVGLNKIGAAKQVIQWLKHNDDPALRSKAWPLIRTNVESDPQPYLETLGLEMATHKKPGRTFVQIFTKPQRLEATFKQSLNPIGFKPNEMQTLSCVGFGLKPPLISGASLQVVSGVSQGKESVEATNSDEYVAL